MVRLTVDTKIYGIKLIIYLCEYNHNNGVMYHGDVLIICIVLFNYQEPYCDTRCT